MFVFLGGFLCCFVGGVMALFCLVVSWWFSNVFVCSCFFFLGDVQKFLFGSNLFFFS